jgi:hypothetical protein
MTFLEYIDQIPPFIVWASAHGGRGKCRPTLNELVELSGLSQRTFTRISRKISWAGVKAGHISQFCAACGIDLQHPGQIRTYFRNWKRTKRPFPSLSPRQIKALEFMCSKLNSST